MLNNSKNRLKRPPPEKSRFRHILLAIKPRYLENHASQIKKSYYGILSESHRRSFRIRHENSLKAPPSGDITMTSYPACNKSSLSRILCILDKKVGMERYQEVTFALSESVKKKSPEAPLVEKSQWSHIRLAVKPRYLGNNASHIKSYYGTLSGIHGRSFRIRHKNSPEAPPSGEITMTSYPACNETSFRIRHE